MKNKKLLYILIPCTLVLWGIIVYKIIKVTSAGSESTQSTQLQLKDESIGNNAADTFSIRANYRDPFFGNKSVSRQQTNNISQTSNQSQTPTNVNKPPSATKQVVLANPFPDVIYNGMIQNKQNNKMLAMIQINGQNNIMKVGDVINDVELLNISKDQIEVKYLKEKRIVVK